MVIRQSTVSLSKKELPDSKLKYEFKKLFESSNEFRKAYYYILGQYLGDGYIDRNGRTFRLRISCDSKYKDIIKEINECLGIILPFNSVYNVGTKGCTIVNINSKYLNEMFPQNGYGKKHTRKIQLVD